MRTIVPASAHYPIRLNPRVLLACTDSHTIGMAKEEDRLDVSTSRSTRITLLGQTGRLMLTLELLFVRAFARRRM